MAEEKKQGAFSKFFGSKRSGCCDVRIEEVSEEGSETPEAHGSAAGNEKQAESAGKAADRGPRASPCCGSASAPKSGGCCG